MKKVIRLPPLPSIRDLIKLYQIRALKQMSQNFLLDPRITSRIVNAAGQIKNGQVFEVGPGPGSITRSILNKSPKRVIVLEKDRRFLPTLEQLKDAAPCELDIIIGDILSMNMEALFPSEDGRPWADRPPNIHLIGNLPFNVATPLIIRWLADIADRRSAWKYGRVRMTLTFQKEVAERMVAPVLTTQRCRLSTMVQNWCHVEHKFTLPGRVFLPKPDVDVGVVHLIPLVKPVIDLPFTLVENVMRCLFSHRQKYCNKSLGQLFPASVRIDFVTKLLTRAEINYTNRALQLSVEEIGRICHAYNELLTEYPYLTNYNTTKRDSQYEEQFQAEEMEGGGRVFEAQYSSSSN